MEVKEEKPVWISLALAPRLCAVNSAKDRRHKVTVVVCSVQCSVQCTASAAEAAAPGVSKSTFW